MTKGSSFSRKKGTLIALACAAAFAVPQVASAQENLKTVLRIEGHPLTVQGAINTGYARIKANGATLGPAGDYSARSHIWTGESNIRFSGSSKLGGSFFQGIGWTMESGFNTDSGGSGSSQGFLASRNTGVGVKTTVGSIWGGRWDTPYKTHIADHSITTSAVGLMATQTGFGGSQGFGGGTGGASPNGNTGSIAETMNFRRRQSSTLNYLTPNLGGFQVHLQFSPEEEQMGINLAGGQAPAIKPQLYSARAQYAAGNFDFSLAYEQHNDYLWGGNLAGSRFGVSNTIAAGAGTNSKDKAYSIAGMYSFGDTKLMAFWEKLKWGQSGPLPATGLLTGLDSSKWNIGFQQKLSGPHHLYGAYGRVGSYGCSHTNPAFRCGDTGAQHWNFLYRYQLDKVSYINVFYARMDNDRNGQYVPGSGLPVVTGNAAGATTGNTNTSMSIGVNTTF